MEKMDKKRSRGVTFWGNLILIMGIGYGVINSARNIWRADYIILPILFFAIGLGVLYLKNWARLIFIILAIFILATGIFFFPNHLQNISKFAEEGKGWQISAIVAFVLRFIFATGGLIFFFQPLVKEQFKGGAK